MHNQAPKKVLLISNQDDLHTRKIAAQVKKEGGEPVFFAPETLGDTVSYRMSMQGGLAEPEAYLLNVDGYGTLNLLDCYSVWYRQPHPVTLQGYELSPDGLAFAREEWRSAIEGAYVLMSGALWISHPHKLRDAAHQPLQHLLANRLGLTTPRTLITNDPDAAAEFTALCRGKINAQPVSAGWLSPEKSGMSYMLTDRAEGEPSAIDDLWVSPVALQEVLPRAYKVKVNVVGQQALAIRNDSPKRSITNLDRSHARSRTQAYVRYELPDALEQQCIELTHKLGLEFATLDLIRKQDGDYVFMELNGNGQILWAEEITEGIISQAIARLLVGLEPPLQWAKWGQANEPRMTTQGEEEHQPAVHVPQYGE